jgi:transcriptional regulator with XRE-family HTH domain
MPKKGGWPPTGFGARLRALRDQRGWTQAQLAERAGCNSFTVAKTERGEQEPAWPLVLALARALGVGVAAFVADETRDSAVAGGKKGGRSAKPADEAPARRRGRPPKAK